MDQQKKLYIACGVMVALAGVVFVTRQSEQKDAQKHSLAGQTATLPKLDLTEDAVKSIDRIELVKAGDADAGPKEDIVLVKAGEEDWNLQKPAPAKANASNVKSLLDNLPKLSLSEKITDSKDEYKRWGVSDQKALHATFYKGNDAVFDVYFGENGSRGQMTRLAKQDGVFAIKGFSKWLYDRDAKGWRDKSMFKFDDKDVVKVDIQNKNGEFTFEKAGTGWSSKFAKAGAKGAAAAAKPIDKFQASKVDDLLRAYKGLSAMDFGDGKKPEEVGLAAPQATVTIELKGGTGTHILKLGDTADASNRWASTNGSDQIYTISSWSSDWATADVSKFQASAPATGSTKPASVSGDSPH